LEASQRLGLISTGLPQCQKRICYRLIGAFALLLNYSTELLGIALQLLNKRLLIGNVLTLGGYDLPLRLDKLHQCCGLVGRLNHRNGLIVRQEWLGLVDGSG
jgi:hypothetical protein